MPEPLLPLVVEADVLQGHLEAENLLVVDLTKPETYAAGHVPGAVYLDYPHIIRMAKPVGGLLPDAAQLTAVFSRLGMTPDTHVVAYDDEGGGKAARLLWTLEAIGHKHYSLLNGGLHVWSNEGHPMAGNAEEPAPSDYQAEVMRDCTEVVDRNYVLEHLDDPQVVLLDARSPAEFCGEKCFAARGGHIPGAINIEWTEFMDQGHNLRLKGIAELRNMLEDRGITPDKTVVVYCHTHHRSAHTWLTLKYLGYPDVRGYEASWSDWGNQDDTPIES